MNKEQFQPGILSCSGKNIYLILSLCEGNLLNPNYEEYLYSATCVCINYKYVFCNLNFYKHYSLIKYHE